MWCSQRPVEDIRFPGTRITDGDGGADCFHYWPVICEGGRNFEEVMCWDQYSEGHAERKGY